MIPIEIEPKEMLEVVAERCNFCRVKTRYWYKKHVPVCPMCAEKHNVEDIHKYVLGD